jgi:hypothetical protein
MCVGAQARWFIILFQDMFADQTGPFHLILPLQDFIGRNKDAFPSAHLADREDPVYYGCLRGRVRRLIHWWRYFADSLSAHSSRRPHAKATLGDGKASLQFTALVNASPDNLPDWPVDYLSRSLSQQCGHVHTRIKRFQLEDAPRVWAFDFIRPLRQGMFIPMQFRVPLGGVEAVATYVSWFLTLLSGFSPRHPERDNARHSVVIIRIQRISHETHETRQLSRLRRPERQQRGAPD